MVGCARCCAGVCIKGLAHADGLQLRAVVCRRRAVHRRVATCGPYRSTQKRDSPAANASMLRSA